MVTESFWNQVLLLHQKECGRILIQKQLVKLEQGGLLVSKSEGRTRLYRFNPRYSFLRELKALLDKTLSFFSQAEQERLLVVRRRPRRKDKPL